MWDFIKNEGPKYGYFQEEKKTWLIVKPEFLSGAKQVFSNTGLNITTEGRKHLGAAVWSASYKEDYVNQKVDQWIKELTILSKIAHWAPHEAYACFVSGYKHKLNYCMRTIPDIEENLMKVDQVITTHLIPAITGGIKPSEEERTLFTLPASMGGLGLPLFHRQAKIEFDNSSLITEAVQEDIIAQNIRGTDGSNDKTMKMKQNIKKAKLKRNKDLLQSIIESTNKEKQNLIQITTEKGASSWLTTLPIKMKDSNWISSHSGIL